MVRKFSYFNIFLAVNLLSLFLVILFVPLTIDEGCYLRTSSAGLRHSFKRATSLDLVSHLRICNARGL